ncbi:MAG: O-antigen ligase family protein [Clostridia bacterium]|nr:O-antigen ligase family protein [Clostridia bacterium]
MKILLQYICWFGLFVFVMIMSKYWAYSTLENSKTALSLFRIFIIGFFIYFYADTREKIFSVMESFVLACFIMGLAAFITSGSDIGTTDFGSPIGQHRNQIGAVAAPLSVICYILNKRYELKYGKFLSLFFIILTVVTGSRSSILQLGMIIALLIFLDKEGMSKKIQRVAALVVGIILVVVFMQNIPFLNEMIWSRIMDGINTVTGAEEADMSALGREYYKDIALMMFKQRPLLGYGMDGFTCYVRDNPTIMGTYMRAVYSHCNYSEIAADLGLLGLFIWYCPIIYIIIKFWKIKGANNWTACLCSAFISVVVFDYSRIPWETHLVMYLYFIMIILYNLEQKNLQKSSQV